MASEQRVLTLPGGRDVATLWTAPESPRGMAVLQHGFARSPKALEGVAQLLAAAGIATVRPYLSSLRSRGGINDREHVGQLGRMLGATADGLPLIAIGHSAGAAAVVHMAAQTSAVTGLLLLDGVDSPRRAMATALPALADRPLLSVTGEPSACNRQGAAIAMIARMRTGPLGVRVVGGGHGDVERIASDGPAPAVYRVVCGDASGPEEVDLLARLIIGWAQELLGGRGSRHALPSAPPLAPWLDSGRLAVLPDASL